MGTIETAVQQSKRIEALLSEQFNADGRGLHEKVSSVESQLPKLLVRQIRWIATLRNKAVHEDNFELDDPAEFVRRADHVVSQLQQLAEAERQRMRQAQQRASRSVDGGQGAKSWQQQSHAKLSKPVKWFLCLLLAGVVGLTALQLYTDKRQADIDAARERLAAAQQQQQAQARAAIKAEIEKAKEQSNQRAQVKHTPPSKSAEPANPVTSPVNTVVESTGNSIKVSTGGLAAKVAQAQDGLGQAKQQLTEQVLQRMMQQLQVSVGDIGAAAEQDGGVAILLPIAWQIDQQPLLKVLNQHFRDYQGRTLEGGKVALDDGRDKDNTGIVINGIWNSEEHQHQPHSEVLYQWLVKHQLRLEASFGGHKNTLVLASGRDCHVRCRGRGDDQFQLLTGYSGNQGEPLMMYQEQNPLRISGLKQTDFTGGDKLSLALVLLQGNKEVGRRDLSALLPQITNLPQLPQQAAQDWKQLQQDLQQNVLQPMLQQANLSVGELRVEPAKTAGHSDLYIPLSWQLPEQTIVAALNRYFHDYRQSPIKAGNIEMGSRFDPSMAGIEIQRYANQGNDQKQPLSERAYRWLLANPIAVRAAIGEHQGTFYLATGLDCHVRCRQGGDDRYRLLLSDKQSGKANDKKMNELVIKEVPNSQLAQLDGLTLSIEQL